MKRPAPAAASAFFVLLVFAWGCGEGGCGEAPETPSQGSSGAAGSSPGRHGGGGGVSLTAAPRQAGETDRKAAPPGGSQPAYKPLPPGSCVESVDAAAFKTKVLKKPGALVSLFFPGCADCDLIAPVMKNMAAAYKGKVDFYRMDASAPENLAALPQGFTAKAYPSFLLYKEGSAVSWKDGLPFGPRGAGASAPAESVEEYQGRLSRWLGLALARGNLGLAE